MNKELLIQCLDVIKSEYSTGGTNKYSPYDVMDALEAELAKIEKKEKSNGCKRKLASGQWWHHCGDTDFGSMPALCTECGGDLKLEQA